MTAIVRRLPAGALFACLFVGLIHIVVSGWVVPHPVARESLRQRVIALTEHARPSLLIAGDSRAENNIMPGVVAAQVGMPIESVVNVAMVACESSAVLAAYREFSERFAHEPIVVISVSLFSVNDRVTVPGYLNDEVLWSIGLVDRLRLAPLKRALSSTLLPERELKRRIAGWFRRSSPRAVPEQGFMGLAGDRCVDVTPETVRDCIRRINRGWFNDPVIDGIRWRQLEADLRSLIQAGVQVVIFDAPEHPAFPQGTDGTDNGAANARFHEQLIGLCHRIDVPILCYGTDWFGDRDPDALYYDLLHLNRRGAALLSERVGQDLSILMQSGRLRSSTPRTR